MLTNRRLALGFMSGLGALFGVGAAKAAPEQLKFDKLAKDADIACLYHCDFGDPQRFSQMLQNINNHLSAYDFDPMKIKIVLVIHGPGLKFFLADRKKTPWENDVVDPEIIKRYEGLTKFGVEAYLCQITYKRLNIDPPKHAMTSRSNLCRQGWRRWPNCRAKALPI